MDYITSVFGQFGFIIAVLIDTIFIAGTVFSYIALTHSVKRRIVAGESFSAGSVFLWILGWGFAAAFSFGIATIIYFLTERSKINATKARCEQLLQGIRYQNQAARYPGYYPPQQTQFPPQR